MCVCVCSFLGSLHSYLLAVGLECGRILLYKWSPVREPAGGHDWSSCGETDILYPYKPKRSPEAHVPLKCLGWLLAFDLNGAS